MDGIGEGWALSLPESTGINFISYKASTEETYTPKNSASRDVPLCRNSGTPVMKMVPTLIPQAESIFQCYAFSLLFWVLVFWT